VAAAAVAVETAAASDRADRVVDRAARRGRDLYRSSVISM